MYILIYGEDTYRTRQQIRKMVTGFQEKRDPQKMNVSFFDCKKEGADKLWGQLGTAPFLADKRMVVINDCLDHYDKKTQEALLEKLSEGAYSKTNVLIFVENKNEFKKNKLFDFLKEQQYSVPLPLMENNERETWVKNYISKEGHSITTGATRMICEGESSTWQLAAIADQALSLADDQEIQRMHVEPFANVVLDDNIFNFTDALAAGNTQLAFKLLRDQQKSDANAFYLLSMIMRQFRILLQIHDLDARDTATAKEISLHPYVLKKSTPLAKRYSVDQLKNIHKQLLKIETLLKTTSTPQDALLDNFILKTTTH